MSSKPVAPREAARLDVDQAVDFYAHEAGAATALRFVDALEAAYGAISRGPRAGSPRYAHELDLPGLRSRAVRQFPYLIFYVELDDRVDIWRVLHARRDIPASLLGETLPPEGA